MAKKDFTNAFGGMFKPTNIGSSASLDPANTTSEKERLEAAHEEKKEGTRGRPKKTEEERLAAGTERASIIVKKEQWAKLKEICKKETILYKEGLELALSLLIEQYEKKHGEIIPTDDREKDLRSIL